MSPRRISAASRLHLDRASAQVKTSMLIDLLNLVNVPAVAVPATPPADASLAPSPAEASTSAAGASGAATAATASAVDSDVAAAAALRHVDAEFARSKAGGWRRLFPSARSADYPPFLDPSHVLHRLPFAT